MDASMFFVIRTSPTTDIYTLSLHDALPICLIDEGIAIVHEVKIDADVRGGGIKRGRGNAGDRPKRRRSEEHTSELQSLRHLVCRLLLEKKKKESRMTSNMITLRLRMDASRS